MILPKYADAFASLTTDELAILLPALSLPVKDGQGRPHDGAWLYSHCTTNHVSHADVCLSLYNVTGPVAISCLERLIMRPIDRRTPYEVNVSRLERPPGSHRSSSNPSGTTRSVIPPTSIIRMLVEGNPKKPGSDSHVRFTYYRDGMTVAEYYAAGGRKADLPWDSEKGFIRIDDASASPSEKDGGTES